MPEIARRRGAQTLTHSFHDFAELFPKFDCGLCGYPTCRALARRVVAGRSGVNSCPHLTRPAFEANSKRLTGMSREGVDGARSVILEEARIVYVRPCISEAGKVTASTRLTLGPSLQPALYGLFDAVTLCLTLELAKFMGDTKCSPSLGTARIVSGSQTLLVSKDGILNLRGAENRDQAVSTIRTLSRTLWGAAVCPACGNVGFDCSSGGCTECFRSLCPILKNGPPDMLEKPPSLQGEISMRDALDAQNFAPQQGRLGESILHLDEATSRIARVAGGSSEGDSFDAVRRELEVAMRSAVAFITETENLRDAVLGFVFMGLSFDLSRITDALKELSTMKPASQATEIAEKATGIALKGYERFRSRGRSSTQPEDYRALREAWSKANARAPDDRSLVWALKALENAFYICRLPDLRLPR